MRLSVCVCGVCVRCRHAHKPWIGPLKSEINLFKNPLRDYQSRVGEGIKGGGGVFFEEEGWCVFTELTL